MPFPKVGAVIIRKLHHRPQQTNSLTLWNRTVHWRNLGSKAKEEILSASSSRRTRTTETSVRGNQVKVQPEEPDVVRNPSQIQMISDVLYSQVFPGRNRTEGLAENTILRSRSHLKAHGLWSPPLNPSPSITFTLPPLEGPSIDAHFRVIAEQQAGGYKSLLKNLIDAQIPDMPLEWKLEDGWTKYLADGTSCPVPFPEEDAYVFDVEVCVPNGPLPVMAAAVSSKSWYSWCSPNLVHGVDTNPTNRITWNDLIPFETYSGETQPRDGVWKEKIIVGHNVSYDRTRIREQYFLEETKLRFLDTMSIHIAVSGITSFQRALKMTMKSGLQPLASDKREELMIAGALEWNDISSLNNLKDVYKLYCDKELEKDTRDIFLTGNIMDIRNDFQNTMSYCARDVRATHEVIVKLLPSYYERFPHPVTLSGMLEMGMAYLPINSNWLKYMNKAEESYHNLEREMKSILVQKAEEAVKLLDGEKYKSDPWLWDLDWKVTKPRKKKVVKNSTDESSSEPEAPVQQSYPAWYKKLFYKAKDEDFMPGPSNISTSMRVVPKLLRLCWFGFPLHYSKKGGWGYLVKNPVSDSASSSTDSSEDLDENSEPPDEEDKDTSAQFPYEQWEQIWSRNKEKLIQTLKDGNSATNVKLLGGHVRSKGEDVAQELKDFINGLDSIKAIGLRNGKAKKGSGVYPRSLAGTSPHPKCEFRPLPHKDGANFRVGNPLAKDFLNKLEEGILSCESGEDIADTVVRLSKMVSYWRNNRDRIMEQVTVWMRGEGQNQEVDPSKFELGAILPQVSVAGTLTRRAVERTWLTASNAYVDRVGSELKGMIQAPPRYHFVGADVDSQELWIASVIGDSDFAGFHGSTALGWMTLQGTKSAGTDMHSKTASLIGIDRDQAKILNYGRIYGAGVTFAERLLMQFNHQMSSTEARTKARAMYQMTKGTRKYILNEEGLAVAENLPKFRDRMDEPVSREELRYLVRSLQNPPADYMDLVKKVVWDEGTESPMFNRLEEIAQQECPMTPILGCCISRSLVPSVVHQDFMTSRVNWVVQSSAVDYLHLMLTSARWLFKKYGIQGRFSISVHDEVRYLVKSEDRYRAAMALQITNLLTRAACSYNLGMYDLPQSVAFFSCVDIDKVLRKEVTQDAVTPSNPDGLSKGYGIPQGEALTIFDILDITKGSLERS